MGGFKAFGTNYHGLRGCKWKYDRKNVFSKGPRITCQKDDENEENEDENEEVGENDEEEDEYQQT